MAIEPPKSFDPTNPARWRVRITRPEFNFCVNFYIYRIMGDRIEFLTVKDGQHYINSVQLPAMIPTEPTLRFSGFEANEMMAALADALEEEGVKTPNDFKVQGLLEATREHLADLRYLLKLPRETK